MPDPRRVHEILSDMYAAVPGSNVQDRLYTAWIRLRNRREAGACSDEELAIAEHYAYARYVVAKDGYTNYMKMLVLGYSAIKALGLKGLLPKTGRCEVSSFSRLEYNWSSRGADDGLEDYLLGSKSSNYELRPPDLPD